jgi:hypothetical protein
MEMLEPVSDRAETLLHRSHQREGNGSRSAGTVAVVVEPDANPPDRPVRFPNGERCRQTRDAGQSFACAGKEGEVVSARPLEVVLLGRCGCAAMSGIRVDQPSARVTAGPSDRPGQTEGRRISPIVPASGTGRLNRSNGRCPDRLPPNRAIGWSI